LHKILPEVFCLHNLHTHHCLDDFRRIRQRFTGSERKDSPLLQISTWNVLKRHISCWNV
jgi:hypothetical protein